MADLGELKAKITAETGQFVKDVDKAGDSVKGLGKETGKGSKEVAGGFKGMSSAVQVAAKAFVALGLLKVAADLAKLTVETFNQIDANAKLARQMGITNTELATLSRAADLSGISIGELENQSRKLNQALVDATEGAGPAADAFNKLGLNAEDIIDLDMQTQLETLGRAFEGIESRAQRASIANDIFGRSGGRMLVLLEEAEATFGRASSEVDAFGLGLDELDTRNIEAVNDNISSMKAAFEGISQQFAATVAPAILNATNALLGFITKLAESNREYNEFQRASQRVGTDAEQQEDRLLQLLGQRTNAQRTLAHMQNAMYELGTEQAEADIANIDAQIQAERRRQAELARGQALHERGTQAQAEEAARLAEIEADKAIEAEAAAARQKMHLDAINQAYAQTHAGQVAALQSQIDYFSGFAIQGPKTLEILKMLNEQMADLTAGPAAEDGAPAEAPWWQEQLEGMQEFAKGAVAIEQQRHMDQMAVLIEAFNAGAVATQEYHALMEQLEKDHQDRLNDIQQKGAEAATGFTTWAWHKQTASVLGELASMTSGLDKENRTQFAIMKAGAIAQAAISTYEGVARTLGAYPGPLGIALAAGHFAAGIAQVANIAGQQYGGTPSGSPPSADTSTPTQPGSGGGSSGPTNSMFVNVQGEVFSGSMVRGLMDQIAEAQKDGYRVVV